MKSMQTLFFAALVGLVAGSAQAATLSGKIAFEGTAPAVKALPVRGDEVCVKQNAGKKLMDESVVVNGNKTLKNVFVYIKTGLEGKTFPVPATDAVITQEGCHYTPHVFGLQVGQGLDIVNGDPTLHNVHAMPTKSSPFNVGMPTKGMKVTKRFDKPEVMVKMKCDVHNWMSSYIGVLTHPFFGVSGDDGSFTLKDVPAGTYTIEAWHEKYGTQTQQITVAATDTKSVDFKFAAK